MFVGSDDKWKSFESFALGQHRLLILSLLSSLRMLAAGQVVGCSVVLKSTQMSLSLLQPCVHSSAGVSLLLDGSRRFVSPLGSPQQTLDLEFQQSVLLLPPGAEAEISSAYIKGVRLQPPSSLSMRLLVGIVVQPTASLYLNDVLLETDCATLLQYQEWHSSAGPGPVSVDDDGDLVISSWQLGGTSLTSCNITCARPQAVLSASLSEDGIPTNTTTVLVFSDMDFYNALALSSSYQHGPVFLDLQKNVSLVSQLWVAQPISLFRNLTILGSKSEQPGGSGGLITRAILDLQDITGGLSLANSSVVISIRNVTFANVGMVFAYTPVPFTGLGLVPSFLWFFDFKRLLLPPRPLSQLQVRDCDVIVYPEDLEHMSLWATFLTSSVGSIAKAAEAFKIGVYDIQVTTASRYSLVFNRLEAYTMDFTNTTLVSNDVASFMLTSRRSDQPLYRLLIPPNTSAIAVWTQADLQNALASAQRLSVCSPFSNMTVYLHLFTNISLDGLKWPAAGFNISCNITLSGSLDRPGGTWLNFNLLSKFVTLNNNAVLTLRFLTLFNMPSLQRTYNLGDLTQMTLPLWPIGRPMGNAASLLLQGCTVVLPYEEYRSLATVLAVASDGYPSQVLNASLKAIKVASSSNHRISLSSFVGLSMTAINTELIDTVGYAPYSALLGSNIYGTADMQFPYSTPGAGGNRSEGGGLSSAATIAIAVAVPLGAVIPALLVLLLLRWRQRRGRTGVVDDAAAAPGGGLMRPECPTPNAAVPMAVSQLEKNVAETSVTPAASGGNSPLSDQSGETDGQADPSHQDKSLVKASQCDSDATPVAPPLHVELHQLILDFAREIEDKHLTIHDALGSGGFATVYRGTWRGIDVAVKVIEFQDRTAGNEHLQARAMTEAAIAANIQHVNIVTTYSYDIRPVQGNEPTHDTASSSTLLGIGPAPEGGPPALPAQRRSGSSDRSTTSQQAPRMWKLFLIQEFCEVGSLRVALESRMLQSVDGQPNMVMILRLALDVVRGLQHLHKKNIVHGDLTPGNILLKANPSRPGQYIAKLADFGLSVKMNPAQTSVDNNRIGTPFYASPEVRSHGNLTKASDLYALGVVLWEMWHGRPCYQRVRGVKQYIHATGYPSFPPACPPLYADLVARCLRRTLEERPQLGEVNDILRQLLGTALDGLSSGSTAFSEGGTSGAQSYEWPFVLQAANDTDVAAAYGGCFDAAAAAAAPEGAVAWARTGAAEGPWARTGAAAAGGGRPWVGGGGVAAGGSNIAAAPGAAAAGSGPGGVAGLAGQLLAGYPYPYAHPALAAASAQPQQLQQRAPSGWEASPAGSRASGAPSLAATAAGGASWGTCGGLQPGGLIGPGAGAGGGTLPRLPVGLCRMNPEVGCQRPVAQQSQQQHQQQQLIQQLQQQQQQLEQQQLLLARTLHDRLLPAANLGPLSPLPPPPPPGPYAVLEAYRPAPAPPMLRISSRAQPAGVLREAGAVAAAATTPAQAPSLSISLNLPTADDFVTAPGSSG